MPEGPRPGFRRKHRGASGSAPAARMWILVPDGEGSARRAMAILGGFGAVRSDFSDEFGVEPEPIGSGTTACVFRANSLNGGFSLDTGGWGGEVDQVAAKLYKVSEGDTKIKACIDKVPRDLQREVSLLAAVQGHRHMVKFFGLFFTGQDEDVQDEHEEDVPESLPPRWCLAMELCARDLYESIKEARYTEERARPVLDGILGALAHVHAKGIVHRDLKVENIMLREDGSPVLADFGLGCHLDDTQELLRPCGSPGYVAPEVILKEGFRMESDVFSAGVVLFFMFCGKLPFRGPDVMSTLRRSARAVLDYSPHKQFEQVSDECKEYIRLLLAKSPDRRPEAAAARRHPWLLTTKEQTQSMELPPINLAQANAKATLWQTCSEGVPPFGGGANDAGNGTWAAHINSGVSEMSELDAMHDDVDSTTGSCVSSAVMSRARGFGRTWQRFGRSTPSTCSSVSSACSSDFGSDTPRGSALNLRGWRPSMSWPNGGGDEGPPLSRAPNPHLTGNSAYGSDSTVSTRADEGGSRGGISPCFAMERGKSADGLEPTPPRRPARGESQSADGLEPLRPQRPGRSAGATRSTDGLEPVRPRPLGPVIRAWGAGQPGPPPPPPVASAQGGRGTKMQL